MSGQEKLLSNPPLRRDRHEYGTVQAVQAVRVHISGSCIGDEA
jgi:hypothetical protein